MHKEVLAIFLPSQASLVKYSPERKILWENDAPKTNFQ